MHLAEKIGTRRFRTFATLSAQSRHASRRKRRESAALPSITFRCRAFQIDSTQRLTNMRRDLAPGREPDAFHCADLGGDRLECPGACGSPIYMGVAGDVDHRRL